MHGNAWRKRLTVRTATAPRKTLRSREVGNEDRRVLRGGSWSDPSGRCRAASRSSFDASHRDNDVGFRVAVSVAPVLRLDGLKDVRLAVGERKKISFRVNGVPGQAVFKTDLDGVPTGVKATRSPDDQESGTAEWLLEATAKASPGRVTVVATRGRPRQAPFRLAVTPPRDLGNRVHHLAVSGDGLRASLGARRGGPPVGRGDRKELEQFTEPTGPVFSSRSVRAVAF
jgi:hypothetical protein